MGITSTVEGAVVHDTPVWNAHWSSWEIGRDARSTVLVLQLAYTAAIITVLDCEPQCYEGRWCYADRIKATAAAQEWLRQGADEPQGWHRHTNTGRRRTDGDPNREYIHF